MRVASLLPSATDVVVALDKASLLVARSHECCQKEAAVLAAQVVTSPKASGAESNAADVDVAMAASVGGLIEASFQGFDAMQAQLADAAGVYKVDVRALKRLRPDVILTQLQEGGGLVDTQAVRAALEDALGYAPKIVHLAANRLVDVWQDVALISNALHVDVAGAALCQSIRSQMDGICSACRQAAVQRPRVLCLQWADPAYTAGAWVADMLSALPILNVMGFNHDAEPVEPETVANLQPDAVIFSICGLRVSGATQHVQGWITRVSSVLARQGVSKLPGIYVMDGFECLSRPGPLLVHSARVLADIVRCVDAQSPQWKGTQWQRLPLLCASKP